MLTVKTDHNHFSIIITIYLFIGALWVALGFMIVSNIYTTVAYFLHERAWNRIQWGVDDRLNSTGKE